ncbi:hypothetical protein OESDEN_03856, partial [Oesophagostomum dentatum]
TNIDLARLAVTVDVLAAVIAGAARALEARIIEAVRHLRRTAARAADLARLLRESTFRHLFHQLCYLFLCVIH